MSEHGSWEGGLEVFRKDGAIFDAYVRDSRHARRGRPPTGTIAVAVDVSERVADERTLLASREYLRAVTDSMGEGVFTTRQRRLRDLHQRRRANGSSAGASMSCGAA